MHWATAPLRYLLLPNADTGALASVYAATSPDIEGADGLYYGRPRTTPDAGEPAVLEQEPSEAASDPALAEALWLLTQSVLPHQSYVEFEPK